MFAPRRYLRFLVLSGCYFRPATVNSVHHWTGIASATRCLTSATAFLGDILLQMLGAHRRSLRWRFRTPYQHAARFTADARSAPSRVGDKPNEFLRINAEGWAQLGDERDVISLTRLHNAQRTANAQNSRQPARLAACHVRVESRRHSPRCPAAHRSPSVMPLRPRSCRLCVIVQRTARGISHFCRLRTTSIFSISWYSVF